ncbi:MAG: ATP-binding protein, partial [Lachnospiraceae bacterium]|nr:ATP-binding protein [Lachnospiraceae bacterium]
MIFQESETVELKAIVVEDIKKEVIAFANCEGGRLYIGVQDDGTVSGLDNPDETSLQISNMVRDAIKPDLTMFLHYETVT